MAVPTNVRVESVDRDRNIIRWTRATGQTATQVYRSPDGTTYAQVVALTASEEIYEDVGRSSGVRYWYKLSHDSGTTFSSVVTVVTQTCAGSPKGAGSFHLPSDVEELARRVEERFNQLENVAGAPGGAGVCQLCSTNGAIVVDCSSGCHAFIVHMNEDINSISIQWCGEKPVSLEFDIPTGATRCICGFPRYFGFTGDECNDACIVGPRRVRFGLGGPGSGGGGLVPGSGGGVPIGGGGGGIGCNCEPGADGALTIQCCNSNCSIKCGGAKSLNLVACGGVPPYSWSVTGGELALSDTSGLTTTVTPPANTGSGVSGNAYYQYGYDSIVSGGDLIEIRRKTFGCNDQEIAACGFLGTILRTGTCSTNPYTNDCGPVGIVCDNNAVCSQDTCDIRTQAMKDAGCKPCSAVGNGKVVTVTDSEGTAVSKTLTVS